MGEELVVIDSIPVLFCWKRTRVKGAHDLEKLSLNCGLKLLRIELFNAVYPILLLLSDLIRKNFPAHFDPATTQSEYQDYWDQDGIEEPI